MRRYSLGTMVVLAAMAAAGARADVVTLNNGQKLEGRVESIDKKPEKIRFIRGVGSMELPRANVKDIAEEPDSVDYRRLGQQLLEAKSYQRAIETFQLSLAADPNEEASQAGIDKAKAAIEAAKSEAERNSAQEISRDIEQARELVKQEKFTDAENLLKRLSTAALTETQRTAAQLALLELHSAWGFQRLDRLDPKGAEEHYSRVLELDPTNADARDKLLDVWKNDPARRADVLKAYQAKLVVDPDNLELNAKVADSLLAMNKFDEAVGPLEKLMASPRYRAQKYDSRLRSTLREVIRNQEDSGNFDAAIASTEKLLRNFPGEDSSQLVVLQYRKAVATSDPTDVNSRARLIKGLRDGGLKDLAQTEARVVARLDPNNEILRGILREEAEERLAEVRDTLARTEYAVARDMARRFVDNYSDYPDLSAKASEMYERANIEAERQARETRQVAKEIGQRGLEYYQQALSFAEQLRSTEVSSGSRPYSAKQEAIKYARRSIDSISTAVSMDPSLGPITGMDLNARLGDARQLLDSLTASATGLTRYRYVPNRGVSGTNVVE